LIQHKIRLGQTGIVHRGSRFRRLPGKIRNRKTISGLDEAAKLEGVQIFIAGTTVGATKDRDIGGRVLAVTG